MTFKELQEIFDKYRLYKDRGVVRMVATTVIANQFLAKNKKPLWVVFVAPPGGGKSDVTGSLGAIEKDGRLLCEKISDITPTAFASGMRSLEGETSLLERINKNGGMLLFKDFTTLLSQRQDDLSKIMAILREVYDEEFTKTFGNGKVVKFDGKIGLIASCTTLIYHRLGDLSAMGDRFMMYQIEQPDRRAVLEKIWENEDAGIDGSDEMNNAMKEYVEGIIKYVDENPDALKVSKIEKDLRNEFAEIADFTCIARSGVIWDFKKQTINFVPDPEMPTRVLRQYITMASGLMIMNMAEGHGAVLGDKDKKLIYKIAFDSIPNMRRKVIKIIGSYGLGATIEGVADKMGMQFDATKVWVDELTALGVLDKTIDHLTKKHRYKLKPEFYPIVRRYEHIEAVDEALTSDDETTRDDFDF